MNNYTLSPFGDHFLKCEEGLRLIAYRCPAGKLTIGYGHRVKAGEPLSITPETAVAYFKDDTQIVLNELSSTIPGLNQHQVDALVSFVYNIGIGAWRGSTAKRDLVAGAIKAVPKELLRWCHDDHGNVIPGLPTRRQLEAAIFEGAQHG